MTQMTLNKDKAPPVWAVLGAPLVGVPIMVALLALTAPKGEPAGDLVPAQAVEQIDTPVVDPVSNDSAARLEQGLIEG